MSTYITHYDWDVGGNDLEDDDNLWSISGMTAISTETHWRGGTADIEVYQYETLIDCSLRVEWGDGHVATVLVGERSVYSRSGYTLYVELTRVMTKI